MLQARQKRAVQCMPLYRAFLCLSPRALAYMDIHMQEESALAQDPAGAAGDALEFMSFAQGE